MSGWINPFEREKEKRNGEVTLSDQYKQALLDIVNGRDTYTYDAKSDPVYQQYREQYKKNARSAAEDVYANATARSGGFGNSYANVAAQQTYNAQMEGVTDIIPELEELAYGRHQTQQQQKLAAYEQLTAMEDAEREARLNNAYLYAFNGTKEGLWQDAMSAESALRAKFPNMTDEDFAEIKAEMYDSGLWQTEQQADATYSQVKSDFGENIYEWLSSGKSDTYIKGLLGYYGIDEETATRLINDTKTAFGEDIQAEQEQQVDATYSQVKSDFGETVYELIVNGKSDTYIKGVLDYYGIDEETATRLINDTKTAFGEDIKAEQEKKAVDNEVEWYVTKDGSEVHKEDVDAAYAWLVGLMQGGVDEDGNEIATVDVYAQKETVKVLAEQKGIGKIALQGAYEMLDELETATKADTQRNVKEMIEEAMNSISDTYYDPSALGIDAEEWADMSDEERKAEVLTMAETHVKRGTLSSEALCEIAEQHIADTFNTVVETWAKDGKLLNAVSRINDDIEMIIGFRESGALSDVQLDTLFNAYAKLIDNNPEFIEDYEKEKGIADILRKLLGIGRTWEENTKYFRKVYGYSGG